MLGSRFSPSLLGAMTWCDPSIGSTQLECDKTHLQGTVGRSLTVKCKYATKRFLFSKKYWCHGEFRSTCEIVADTEGFTKADLRDRIKIQDLKQHGLFIWMANLHIKDTGVYWAGIDKMYADIMYQIHIKVSEEAVAKPRVWFPRPPELSCWGQPLVVHCASDHGTRIHYAWYRTGTTQDVRVSDLASLHLNCAALEEDARYYCVARNSIGNQSSHTVTAKLLRPAEKDCIYAVTITNDSSYDCRDRLETTTIAPSETTPKENMSCFISSAMPIDHTTGLQNSSRIAFMLPLWYVVVRWLLLSALLLTFGLVWTFSRTARNTRTSSSSVCKHHTYNSVTFPEAEREAKL
ncbi:hypothetical protein GN956_G18725 [Arapaima gigas]